MKNSYWDHIVKRSSGLTTERCVHFQVVLKPPKELGEIWDSARRAPEGADGGWRKMGADSNHTNANEQQRGVQRYEVPP